MVSLQCIENENLLPKQGNNQLPLTGASLGIEVPLYRICWSPLRSKRTGQQVAFASDAGHTRLDTLLLAKWEDFAWKNRFCYDITACPTQILNGGKRFLVQLNENQNINSSFAGSKQFSTSFEFELNIINIFREDILFCLQRGDNDNLAFVPWEEVPKGSILVIANASPVEYGHVLLVPYQYYHPPYHVDFLESMLQVATELNNSSFAIAYDHKDVSGSGRSYFQFCWNSGLHIKFIIEGTKVALVCSVPSFSGSTK